MPSARLVACVAAVATLCAAASASNGAEQVRWFEMRAVSSGSYTADFGEERKAEGLSEASTGVDGKIRHSWRWEVLAVGRGDGDRIDSVASIFRYSVSDSSSLVLYILLKGELSETPLCKFSNFNRPGFKPSTESSGHAPGTSSYLGGWVQGSTYGRRVGFTGSGFSASAGGIRGGCYHSPHGLSFQNAVYAEEARVPRGAFNPRFDKSYSKTYSDEISLGPRHATSDPNAFHTFEGKTKLTVKVAEISARSAERRSRSYGKYGYNG